MKKFISLLLAFVLSTFSSLPVFAGNDIATSTPLVMGNNVMTFFVSNEGYVPNSSYQIGVYTEVPGLEGYILDFNLENYNSTPLTFENITLQAPTASQSNDGFVYMIEMPQNLFREILMLPGHEVFGSGQDYFIGLDGASDNSADFQVSIYEDITQKNLGNEYTSIDSYYFLSVIEKYLNYDVVDNTDPNIDGTNIFLRIGLLTESEQNSFGDYIGVRPHASSWTDSDPDLELLQSDENCNYSTTFTYSGAENSEVFMSNTANHGFGPHTMDYHLHIDDADIDKGDSEYKVNIGELSLIRSFPSSLVFFLEFDGVMKNGAQCIANGNGIPEFNKYTYYGVFLFAIFLMRNRLKDLLSS